MSNKPQDFHLLNVPFEALKRVSRERKHLLDSTAQLAEQLKAELQKGPLQASLDDRQKALQRARQLHEMAQVIDQQEKAAIEVIRYRATLSQQVWDASPEGPEWSLDRFNFILADYLQRARFTETAAQLAKTQEIEVLVDMAAFREAQPILDSLRQRDCEPALKWCQKNAARLKRAKSNLEFVLRCQQYIEMVRDGDKLEAIEYSRKWLAPYASQYLKELQAILIALVVLKEPDWEEHQRLFGAQRWDFLEDRFMHAITQLHSLPETSLLELYLQTGLIVLNPPRNYPEITSGSDPWSQKEIRSLAKELPYARHASMRLICPITRQIVDHENKGVLLPNKQVVSGEMLERMKVKDSQGVYTFKHPISGETWKESEWKYVMPV